MGAGALQRGDAVIRQRIADELNEDVLVKREHLNFLYSEIAKAAEKADRLENTTKELRRANLLIQRLRAENEVLKDEKAQFFSTIKATMRHISIAGNAHKKYGVALIKRQLEKARLI